MSSRVIRWMPAAALCLGAILLSDMREQTRPQLAEPLVSALPDSVDGLPGIDTEVPEDEAAVAGFTDYALRLYGDDQDGASSSGWASIYVGFYDTQTRGRTIHSPRNCLPGSGWEALSSTTETLGEPNDSFTVNRYVLQNGDSQALVLYWYQGRGRVAHNEYLVKWDLLRDAALMKRTDEALVRIVVPISGSEEEAFELARRLGTPLKRSLDRALPST